MKNNYISLHTHSDGSQLDGIQTVEEIAEKASKLKMSAVALTDHGKAGNLLSFKKACEKHNVKPIYGTESYLAPFSRFQKEKIEGYKYASHMCLLAKNEKGLQNLFKLTSIGWTDGLYYNKPRIDLEALEQYKEGLIGTGGCGSGFISQMILDDKFDEAINRAKELKRIFGDDFYLEVQNHDIDWQLELKKGIIEISKLVDIPIVVTQDSHYCNKEDKELHKHIIKLNAGDFDFNNEHSYFKSYDELRLMFNDEDQYMFDNTYEVANKCNCEWNYGNTIWPVYNLPENKTPDQELRELTERGFKELISNPTDEYRERIKYELDVISKMGFSTYFLIVADFLNWARNNNIPTGPGRGCLTGDTPVFASFGHTIRLDKITPGINVISHTGKHREVINTFEYEIDETLLNIKTFYGDYNGISMTKDHKVFGEKTDIVENWDTWSKSTRNSRKKYKEIKGVVSEIPAEELKQGDFIFFPKINRFIKEENSVSLRPYIFINKYPCKEEYKDGDIIINEEVPNNKSFLGSIRDIYRNTKVSRGCIRSYRDKEYKHLSKRQKEAYIKIEEYILRHYKSIEQWRESYKENSISKRTVSSTIQLDNDFMWIIGKWIADGWLVRKKDRVWGICFNTEEKDQINKVKNWLLKNNLQYKVYKHKTKKLLQIEVNSGIFTYWWSNLFPYYQYNSQTKYFPDFTKYLSDEKLTNLIKGYIDGDGYITKGKIKVTTTSRNIAQQLKYMLLSLNIPSSITVENRKDHREEFKKTSESYYVSFPILDSFAEFWPMYKAGEQYVYRRTEEGVFCRIKKIEEVKEIKKVYDITVEQDSSYLTTSGAVHNSAAGSLVCYLIGITEIDPIPYGLYFQRFLNESRVSLPDVDCDISPAGRRKVMDYVAEKYGKEKCAQIGTYSLFKPRGSLKDFSRTCGLERSQGDALAALIPPDVNGKSLTFDEAIKAEPKILKSNHKEVVNLARKAEGIKKTAGVHAAGVLISDTDIGTQLPLFTGRKGEVSAQFDMHDCEEIGLVKYDFLGLKNLDVISDTISHIKDNHSINIDFKKIPTDDQDVYKNIFQTGKLDGVFQFETSAGFRDLCFKVKPRSIEDLSAITSIFRPGPLCISGDSKICTGSWQKEDNKNRTFFYKTLKEMHDKIQKNKEKVANGKLKCLPSYWLHSRDLDNGKLIKCKIKSIIKVGEKDVYNLKIKNKLTGPKKNKGKINSSIKLKTTLEHKFLTLKGWKELKDIKKGEYVCILRKSIGNKKPRKDCTTIHGRKNFRNKAFYEYQYKCVFCDWDKGSLDVNHIEGSRFTNNNVENLVFMCPNHHREYTEGSISKEKVIEEREKYRLPNSEHFRWVPFVGTEYVGKDTVYDIEVDDKNHNFIANDFVVHNSSGLDKQYIEDRQGKKHEHEICKLKNILHETGNIMIFQEQIMKICTDLAGYTLSEADNMRKIIGKKMPEKMKLEKEKFVNGCENNNISKQKAEKLFSDIEKFSSYCFNKSHAISYSVISYRTAWLKHYYPLEFYTALLNHSDTNEAIQYIHAAKADGISILPPDINHSGLKFTNDNGTILFGLSGIKGIGQKGTEDLIEKRKEINEFSSIEELIKLNINKGIICRLAESGALEEISDLPREELVANIENLIDYYKKLTKWNEREERIAEREKEIELWDINKEGKKPRRLPKNKEKPEFPEVDKDINITAKDKLTLENKTLGFYISGHPLDYYENLLDLAKYNIKDLQDGKSDDKEKISIPIVVSKINEIRTRKEQNMANIIIEDKTGRETCTIFPRQWKKLKEEIKENEVYILNGTLKKVEQEEDSGDSKTIINIIVTNVNRVEEREIKKENIDISLKDGSIWIFDPEFEINNSKRQQAIGYIKSYKRMN